ncbi:DUF3267 domain-containing protein [Pontibacter rugosus]|uniref:DUF3267 domain-containing protein n=1 Tax=Pontibacter rugosus TaxID=1745966 RepID=A0ABW3SN13_9BACT
MQEAQYQKQELAVSASEANAQSLLLVAPVLLLYVIPYLLLWPEQFKLHALEGFIKENNVRSLLFPLVMLLVFIAGAVVHELLHGLTWAAFCKQGLRSIKYGMHWKQLSPYCHCKELLPLKAYVLGTVMPGLVLGLIPALVGLLLGQLMLFLFGLCFTLAAASDFLGLWSLRHAKATDLVQDHPEKIGCLIYRKL